MAKTVKINGTDYTSYFTPVGQTVSYESIQGDNAGYMINGTYTEDEIALKANITLTCMPLTEAQSKNILQELYSNPYSTVYYYDPKDGAYRTITARRSVSEIVHRGAALETEYWTGYVITFTEK